MTTKTTPSIYVACLAAYNNGRLHGAWISAAQDEEAIQTEISAMLAASPEAGAEEWAIHDFEGFGELRLSEYEGIERVSALAAFIGEHEALGAKVLAHFCGDIDEALSATENYRGCYESLADFAQELTEETSTVPAHLANYIDYESMGRDMEMNGDLFTIETAHDETHVFWGS
ncbi:MAG: antirestriction protein ArdA [Verrucomicrobia bacterium]|nr:antirestriction protein ArdA [Verrucomicrobiota bacterium]